MYIALKSESIAYFANSRKALYAQCKEMDKSTHAKLSIRSEDGPVEQKAAASPTTHSADPPQPFPSVETTNKRKRAICGRCERPALATCICPALPDERITLKKCHVIILQHPHEARRKNRSVPLVQLCFDPSCVSIVVARRFGDMVDPHVMSLLQSPNRDVWLMFPSNGAVSLSDALKSRHQKEPKETISQTPEASVDEDNLPLTLVFLDATWKQAQEMDKANQHHNLYPGHMVRIAVSPKTDFDDHTDSCYKFRPRRFDIRTPPSEEYLSTAECVSLSVSRVEGNPDIHRTLMKPLDLMVEKWKSFSSQNKRQKRG